MNAALQLTEISLDQIRPSTTPSQTQRRKYFDKTKLAELAESVATHGVLQPIIVRRVPAETAAGVTAPEYFEIVAGERRVLAARDVGHVRIPANVLELSDEQVIEIQLIENLQREDVHPMQEAEGYHELVHKFGHPIEELYTKVKSRSYVYGRMKLLALCDEARAAFYKGDLDQSRALLVARIPGEELQQRALKQITEKRWDGEGPRMSYREAQRYVHDTFMLKLSTAPFDRADATLVPSAGACGPCPMRTGNAPDLFDDVNGADVCTNPECFKAKKAAHVKRELERARTDGAEIIRGGAAKKILPDSRGYWHDPNGAHKQLRNGYARPKDKCLDDPKQRTYAELAGKDAPTKLLQNPDSGRVEKVFKLEEIKDRLEKRGVTPKIPTSAAESREVRQARDREAEERDRAQRHAVFSAILAAAPTKLEHDDLVWIVSNALDGAAPDKDECALLDLKPAKGYGRNRYEPQLRGLSPGRLAQLAVVVPVFADVMSHWGDDKDVEALAKRLGVDTKKIRRDLAKASEKEESAAAKKKTAKKKTKKAKR